MVSDVTPAQTFEKRMSLRFFLSYIMPIVVSVCTYLSESEKKCVSLVQALEA